MSGQIAKQRLAALMLLVHETGSGPRIEGESESDYFTRVRNKATRIQRHKRRLEHRRQRTARKRNQ